MTDFGRARAVVIVPMQLQGIPPGWDPGPLPLACSGQLADRALRSTYFSRRAADALYGRADSPRRWHRFGAAVTTNAQSFDALELLTFDFAAAPVNGLLLAHVSFSCENPVTELFGLTRLGHTDNAVRHLLSESVEGFGTVPQEISRATAVSFACATEELSSGEDAFSSRKHLERLWLLASATPRSEYPLDASESEWKSAIIRLSADWDALVLRDGASFIGRRAGNDPGDFLHEIAPWHVRTIYLDVLVLGAIQGIGLNQLADAMSSLIGSSVSAREAVEVDTMLARFRNVYWWEHISSRRNANELLNRYHDQHHLKPLLEQLVQESADYARRAQSVTAARTNAALSLVTLVGLPITISAGLVPLVRVQGFLGVAIMVALAASLSALLLMTTVGRGFLRSLRDPK